MSHGETFSVAKLDFESTTLPLLTVGSWMSAGFWLVEIHCLGLMRDMVEGTGASASSTADPSVSKTGSEDSRLLFLDSLFLPASCDGKIPS